MEVKADLREKFRAKTSTFLVSHPNCAEESSRSLASLLVPLLGEQGTWAGFCNKADEINPGPAMAQSHYLRWAYPKVHGNNLRFYVPEDPTAFEEGPWGLKEPNPERSIEVSVASLQGILVPGAAFDRKGVRLGRGRGFYDRTLMSFKGTTIGVAFSVQLSETDLPREEHDRAVGMVVTEKSVVLTPQNGRKET